MVINKNTKGAEKLVKNFVNADSTAEIKHTAGKIIESDSDIDAEGLEEADRKFQKEKKEDSIKETQNNADFKQPE